MNLLLALSICASAAAAVASASDQVLVLSAQKQLLHAASPASSSSSGFTSAGLAELAMDALGLATGNVVRPATSAGLSAIQNPVQADIFQHADAYALVFVQDDGALLDSIDAGTTFTDASYHSVFPLSHRHGAAQKVPDVIANEFTGAFGASGGAVKCAGSTAICSATMLQDTVAVDAARVEKVLAENRFLHKDVAEDARFAQELAQVNQLTTSLSSSSNAAAPSFYVVGFSDVQELDSSKRSDASKALAAQVSEFLSALQKTHAASGAQVVAARESAPSAKQSKAMKQLKDVTSYNRLLINLATEPSDSGSSDDDDDDDDSGSSSEESEDEDDGSAANATSSSNSTSAKVSMEEIAEYQIVLWTSVLLGVTLLLAILSMCNMNTGRDSLLYAKFITDAGHRKGD